MKELKELYGVGFMGIIDKFMTPYEALVELVSGKTARYSYSCFAYRDIFSYACSITWTEHLDTGINLVTGFIDDVLSHQDGEIPKDMISEYHKGDLNVTEDKVRDVEFANSIMDNFSIPYHFYIYEHEGINMITIKRDGGVN